MYQLLIKRIYEVPVPADGYRILTDRLWPRGMSKDRARLDEWNKIVAPSAELRKWYGHQPDRFSRFKKQYLEELESCTEELIRIKALSIHQTVTLLYSAKDLRFTHTTILLETIKKTLL